MVLFRQRSLVDCQQYTFAGACLVFLCNHHVPVISSHVPVIFPCVPAMCLSYACHFCCPNIVLSESLSPRLHFVAISGVASVFATDELAVVVGRQAQILCCLYTQQLEVWFPQQWGKSGRVVSLINKTCGQEVSSTRRGTWLFSCLCLKCSTYTLHF